MAPCPSQSSTLPPPMPEPILQCARPWPALGSGWVTLAAPICSLRNFSSGVISTSLAFSIWGQRQAQLTCAAPQPLPWNPPTAPRHPQASPLSPCTPVTPPAPAQATLQQQDPIPDAFQVFPCQATLSFLCPTLQLQASEGKSTGAGSHCHHGVPSATTPCSQDSWGHTMRIRSSSRFRSTVANSCRDLAGRDTVSISHSVLKERNCTEGFCLSVFWVGRLGFLLSLLSP